MWWKHRFFLGMLWDYNSGGKNGDIKIWHWKQTSGLKKETLESKQVFPSHKKSCIGTETSSIILLILTFFCILMYFSMTIFCLFDHVCIFSVTVFSFCHHFGVEKMHLMGGARKSVIYMQVSALIRNLTLQDDPSPKPLIYLFHCQYTFFHCKCFNTNVAFLVQVMLSMPNFNLLYLVPPRRSTWTWCFWLLLLFFCASFGQGIFKSHASCRFIYVICILSLFHHSQA